MVDDLIQSKFSFQREWMGPSLGWVLRPVNNDRIVTGNTSVTRYDRTLVMEVASATSISLPPVRSWMIDGLGGNPLMIKDGFGNAGTYNLTLLPAGSDKIDGASSKIISSAWGSLILRPLSDFTGWVLEVVSVGGGGGISSITFDMGTTGLQVSPSVLSTSGTLTFSWNAATARTALGLGTAALLNSGDITKGFVGLGNADNTSDVNKPVSTAQQAALDLKSNIVRQTHVLTGTTYTLIGTDTGKILVPDNGSGCAITVPNDATGGWTGHDQIDLVGYTAGTVSVVAGAGVTISSEGSKLKLNGQYQAATLLRIDVNTWLFFGAIKA